MTVFFETGSDELKRAFEEAGFMPVKRKENAFVIVSEKPDVMRDTVLLLSNTPKDIPANVIDVLDPKAPYDILVRRARLILSYLYRPRGIFDELEDEFMKAKRYDFPLSIVVILSFESGENVEDVFGLLKRISRTTDVMGFLGNNEILVILPGTDKRGAQIYVARLRKRLIRFGNWTRIPNMIFGIAEVEDWMESAEDLIAAAEYSLVSRKH